MNELKLGKNIIENYRATQILVRMIFKCWRWYDEILREIVLDVNKIERDGVRCDTRKARGCSRCHPLHLSTDKSLFIKSNFSPPSRSETTVLCQWQTTY